MSKPPFILLIAFLLVLSACKKDPDLPPNPYDGIDYPTDSTATTQLDPNTIQGIHQNILQQKCNNPGCHDGSFEPDFRTVQSAWSTLVYHRIVKNDAGNTFTYRVVPYSLNESMFHRRVTVDDPQLQQMPATGNYLTPEELTQVETWIQNGARDMFGNIASLPNNEPVIVGYLGLDANDQRIDETNNRVDSVFYNPFYVDNNVTLKIALLVEDDSTAVGDLQVNQLKFSLDKDDFSGATTMGATFIGFGLNVWLVQLNTGSFPPNTTVYMRYAVNDGDHAGNTEFPRDESDDGYKTYWAFRTRP